MAKEVLIDPLIHIGQGQCPKCGGTLYCCDTEMTFMILDDNGEPIRSDVKIGIDAECSVCGERIQMMRDGWGYRKYSESYLLMKKFGLLQKKKELLSHTDVEGNPFGFNDKDSN